MFQGLWTSGVFTRFRAFGVEEFCVFGWFRAWGVGFGIGFGISFKAQGLRFQGF